MKRIRIIHKTEYQYSCPVTFGPHFAMVRPREGHDVRIHKGLINIEPAADVRWLRDLYGNSVAVITFKDQADRLRIHSEIDVNRFDDNPVEAVIDPSARFFPFRYDAREKIELVPFRLPSYPTDGPVLCAWLEPLDRPGQLIETSELLEKLNNAIHDSLTYVRREEPGVQLPCETLRLKSGSCRDYAVLMIEAARHLGFAARFVTGYIEMGEGQHGATHAWVEVYLPGAGWVGYDPTNRKLAGSEHVSVGVARQHETASPLTGAWSGPADAFQTLEVKVEVVRLPDPE
jgi:transglutaminase-like putative cysteine protease